LNSLHALGQAIYQAGFDAFATVPANPLQRMLPVLKQALLEERYPDFVDGDLEKRVDPRRLQSSAQTVITLAVSYNTGPPGSTPPLHGTISRSAWGLDYHTVLQERMNQVIGYLREHHGAQQCTKAVDTSFLIDRALAVEAGLGYPGSNCAVYVPPFGSWVFLGEILVDIELPPTSRGEQENWSCPVHCDLCIKACPTNALLAPGKIKPQRCLSYLTQMPGTVPMEFRGKLGNRLWGCDTCQQVCPINQEARLTRHQEFAPLVGPHVPLLPLFTLTKREFAEQFGCTSLSWRGKNIIQRNACIVLRNQRNRDALPALEKTAREHPSSMVREAASWAVQELV
jgi:epoxyqueuosine reductase